MEKYLYLITQRKLYFARIDQFEDNAEVLVSDKEINYWKKLFGTDIRKWCEQERKRVFINSWIISQKEVSTMWGSYAPKESGVVIKSTVGRLQKSYLEKEPITLLDVRYINHKTQTVQPGGEPINVLRFFSTKRDVYKAENEIRLIYEAPNISDNTSFIIPIDINVLINEVHIGPNASDEFIKMIASETKRLGYDFEVTKSELVY